MKILIVEDDGSKLQAVAATLQSIDGIPIDIETAQNVNQAKRHLRDTQYDALILDISLPLSADAKASPSAGIELLEEIDRRSVFKKPKEIIGLTAYADLFDSFGEKFSDSLWNLVHFDSTSDAWSLQIERKIRYLHLASQVEEMPSYQSDLNIITALREPEFEAVMRIPWGWKALSLDRDGTQYFEGKYLRDGGERRVIAACSPQMGMTAAAVLATKMIYNFTPRHIGMCGITAGMRGECNAGDVIAGDIHWDWGSGKYAGKPGTTSTFQFAPVQIGISSVIRGRLGSLASEKSLWDDIRNRWTGDKRDTVLSMRIGPFASGAAVLSDQQVISLIKGQQRKVLGIDMESYGVLAAASEAPLPQPSAFVLKSVVDFGDHKKADSHQRYAAYTSAMAMKGFAERYL